MISPESVDRILQAAQIEEVVSDFVKLKKRGVNLLGLCPFHNEKTPSFTVSPVKGIFKCFGCGKSGNSVGFIMEHESLSYPDALRYLAGKYHIELDEKEPSEEARQQRTERESLYIVLAAAQKYYAEQLHESEQGKTVGLTYFLERELLPKTMEDFGLGWSHTERDAFTNWAVKNGYNKDVLVKAGLTIETQDGRFIDRFRERAMFPIYNLSGKVVGFGGRIVRSNAKEAKYINSPETEVYNKSQVLYGFSQAKKAIKQKDACVLVEGYMDVISMHQACIENVVASSGTSLTEDQLRLVKRFTDNIIFFFDGDEPGRKAAVRALDMALQMEMNPKVVTLPAEHDPDSFARANDKDAIEAFLQDEGKDFMQFRLSLLQPEDLKDPLKKAQAVKELLQALLLIHDRLKMAFYIKEIEKALGLDEKLLYEELRRMQVDKFRKENKTDEIAVQLPEPPAEQPKIVEKKTTWQEKYIIRILLQHAEKPFSDELTVGQHIIQELEEIEWEDADCMQVYDVYSRVMREGMESPTAQSFYSDENIPLQKFVTDMQVEEHGLSDNWKKALGRPIPSPADNIKDEVRRAILHLKLRKVQQLIQKNQQDMNEPMEEEQLQEVTAIHQHLLEMKKSIASELGVTII